MRKLTRRSVKSMAMRTLKKEGGVFEFECILFFLEFLGYGVQIILFKRELFLMLRIL